MNVVIDDRQGSVSVMFVIEQRNLEACMIMAISIHPPLMMNLPRQPELSPPRLSRMAGLCSANPVRFTPLLRTGFLLSVYTELGLI